jgi:protein SCO1/2
MIKKGLAISLILFYFLSCNQETKILPYLGKRDVVYQRGLPDTIYAAIPSFTFFNQDSLSVTNETYKNKLWIAEFFFTTCPTICPVMNNQLHRLYNELSEDVRTSVQFLSFTIDPRRDTPSRLRKYRKQHHLPSKNWDFLTGEEKQTHQLGIDHFLTFAGKDSLSAGGYAHSGSFTLVDQKGHVRGVYQITNFDLTVNEQEYKRMVNEIKILYHEYIESNEN